jgi:glucose-6-phosphate 1-dehydrogenase
LFYLSIGPNFISTISNYIKNASLASERTKTGSLSRNLLVTTNNRLLNLISFCPRLLKRNRFIVLIIIWEKKLFRIYWLFGLEIPSSSLCGITYRICSNYSCRRSWCRNQRRFYEQTGALRDMVQNHLLQILCMVAMEAPASLESDEIRDRKVDVLKSIRRIRR